MAPPAWAYQVDYFDPVPDEELVCSICQSVFCDPVQSPCRHVFCRNCIVKWLESNRNCPICRKRTTKSTIKEVVPLVKNMIMKLTLRCHNSEMGCEERFSLENCESHVKDCVFEMVQCKNKPCKMMFMKRDVQEHEQNSCPHSYTRCSSCTLKISSKKPTIHNCVQALLKKVKEKNIKLKKCNEKIKSLESELKASKENNFSSASSLDESFSPSDILFGLDVSDVSSISSVSSSSVVSDTDLSNDGRWTLDSLSHSVGTLGEALRNLSDSIEQPRSSAGANLSDEEVDVVGLDSADPVIEEPEESLVRRPPKRRLNSRLLDSTDEEDNLEDSPLPSRKRTLPLESSALNFSSSSEFNLDAAGPSNQSASNSSTSTNGSPPKNLTRRTRRYNLCPPTAPCMQPPADSSTCTNDSSPRVFTRVTRQTRSSSTTSPTRLSENTEAAFASRNPIFERTLNLLQQYNLESDPEWLPGEDHHTSEEMDSSDCDDLEVLSSDVSSVSDTDSESSSSYADAPDGRTEDLLNSFYGSSSSSDSEWHP